MRHLSGLVLLSCVLGVPTQAQLVTLETARQRLLYIDPTQTYVVPHTARCFENSMEFLRELWGYDSTEQVNVLLSDMSDKGNAAAGYAPRNFLMVETSPQSLAYETDSSNERMNALMNHELVHIVATDKAAGSDRTARKFFHGKVVPDADHPETILYHYLTLPRGAVPRWYSEGLAVFVETWMAGGYGRAQGAYDEMVFRSMVKDDSRFYDPLGLVSEGTRVDFQLEANSYLYGTRFVSYLAYRYSPDHVIRWAVRTEGTKKYFSSRFLEVFGLPLEEAWDDWIEFEHGFQQENLERIRKYPTTPYEDLSGQALGSVSRAYADHERGKIYAAFNYPGVVAHVGAISLEDGSLERLVDVKAPVMYEVTSLTYDPETPTIFYTTDNSAHRDIVALDPETKRTRTLMKDARIGDLAFNLADRSLWGIRHFNGIATLVRIPEPYDQWVQIQSWPYGEVIYNLDVSPDGSMVSTSVSRINGRHELVVYRSEDLLAGKLEPVGDVEFGDSIPLNFVFSPEGEYLYGASYYTGASNIFRYEIATDVLEAVSNAETGFFRPIPLEDERLLVFRYTGEGLVPAIIDPVPLEDVSAISFLGTEIIRKHPVLQDWMVGSPAEIPLESLITAEGEYRGLREVGMQSIYPVVEGYKDFPAYGFRFNLSDPISINRFSFTASYTPNSGLDSDERFHFEGKYERYNWRAELRYNDADFYDLFGPTKTSRKGYSVTGGHKKTLIYDQPRTLRLESEIAYHGDLEKLPRFQNVDATFDELLGGNVGLYYSNRRSSLGAVDSEKGIKAELNVGAQYVDTDLIPGFTAAFDYGVALPWKHSSIWFRNHVGALSGDLADPFANFFFGGFGNNWVDHLSVKRYRGLYAFPGLDLNEVGGRNFAKTMIEWNLPPLRFRNAGTPGFHIPWMRASLFGGAIRTNLDDDATGKAAIASPTRDVTNLGTQIDFRIRMLARLDMTFSVGYAVAFEDGVEDRDEFMYSLKVLH